MGRLSHSPRKQNLQWNFFFSHWNESYRGCNLLSGNDPEIGTKGWSFLYVIWCAPTNVSPSNADFYKNIAYTLLLFLMKYSRCIYLTSSRLLGLLLGISVLFVTNSWCTWGYWTLWSFSPKWRTLKTRVMRFSLLDAHLCLVAKMTFLFLVPSLVTMHDIYCSRWQIVGHYRA